MGFLDSVIQAAQQKLREADAAVGGWIPGGGIPSPATRLVQQASRIVTNPEKQLKNPKTYRAWQSAQAAPVTIEPGNRFNMSNYYIEPDVRTKFYTDPITNTTVEIPEITQGKIFGSDLSGASNPAYEVHFAGPEGIMSKGEFRKYWQQQYGPKDRPLDIFSPEDPETARARGLVLRSQLGRALSDIPSGSWIQTGSVESPYNSRAKLYNRLTQGAFSTDPDTNKITVYKAGPSTWYNVARPEKVVTWNPAELTKQLKKEAVARTAIGDLRESPAGSVVEGIARRLGGPYAQAAMLLDDAIKQVVGVAPTQATLDAAAEQLTRSVQQQENMGVRMPAVWQTAPF